MKPTSRVRPVLLRTIVASVACAAALLWPAQAQTQAPTEGGGETLRSSDLSAPVWRELGPAITSGRITAFAVDPRDTRVIFAASASGGAWKTENAGTTWSPVFENERSVSMGAIALAPSNPDIVWVGTGEQNSVRSSSYGDGVYRSDDGGTTWRHMGLEGSRGFPNGGKPAAYSIRSTEVASIV